MRIHDVLDEKTDALSQIHKQCSQFIEECEGYAVLKNLPEHYNNIQKVKVRKQRGEEFDHTFNEAFNEYRELRQRSVFANGGVSFVPESHDYSTMFYVFPIDGYKFMYCTEVENSKDEYKQVFDSILEGFGSEKGAEVITDMLKFTYTSENLAEGILSGSEIIFYNIPFYYAVRAYDAYPTLLTNIQNS